MEILPISGTSQTMYLRAKHGIFFVQLACSEINCRFLARARQLWTNCRLCSVTCCCIGLYVVVDAARWRHMLQPVGFVTFSSRDSAEAARQALQVNGQITHNIRSLTALLLMLNVWFKWSRRSHRLLWQHFSRRWIFSCLLLIRTVQLRCVI